MPMMTNLYFVTTMNMTMTMTVTIAMNMNININMNMNMNMTTNMRLTVASTVTISAMHFVCSVSATLNFCDAVACHSPVAISQAGYFSYIEAQIRIKLEEVRITCILQDLETVICRYFVINAKHFLG